VLDLTRSYEKEVNDLAHDKTRLLAEVDDLNRELSTLNVRFRDAEEIFSQ
jgi:hypothetical protein